ncbi:MULTISPECIES: hypothetical protein [Bacillus]|uniref:hypothetical protein n=1 Tax=Bacillus TaxID=1386 RepID=UPI000416E577|nr:MULTISPECIES: hypothetical protein [Bacillus]QHZ46281.1 spore coat protein [Bacillus sp. NSP9.1]WFA06503.1 spore coat protein [Bacillus sp. HSf4]
MSDREKLKADVSPLTNTLVQNILRKHGVSKDNVRKLSEGEKETILNILDDLKAQSEALIQKQKEKQKSQAEASSQSEEKPRRRRRSNKLREKLKQRRQQETTAEKEEKNGDLE